MKHFFPARRHRLRRLRFSLLSRSSCDFHFPALRLRPLLVLLLIGNLKRLVMLRCQEAAASQARLGQARLG